MIHNPTEPIHTLEHRLERLGPELAEYLCSVEGERLENLEVSQTLHRPFSQVVFLKAITTKTERSLVMKTVVHHPLTKATTQSENQAVVEFNILSKVYPQFQKVENCSVPRPIVVIPEIETYVMEFVEGLELAHEFRYLRHFSSEKKF